VRLNGKDNKAQVQKAFHRYAVLRDQFAFRTRPFFRRALVSFASSLSSRSIVAIVLFLSFSHLERLDVLESAETERRISLGIIREMILSRRHSG